MKVKKYTILISLISIAWANIALANNSVPQIDNPFDSLQVSIPDMARFSDAIVSQEGQDFNITNNWIGEYIIGLYQYAILIIAIFAALTFIIGGVIWITAAGSPARIKEAQSWMISSILGIIIALSSYLILYTINPELVIFKSLTLSSIAEIEDDLGDANDGESYTGPGGSPYTTKTGNVPCPPDNQNVSVNSFVNYYLTQAKLTYSQSRRDKCYDNGTCYLDCSSFARHMAQCLHLNSVSGEGTTYNLFYNDKVNNNRKIITDCDHPDLYLKPGDLVGRNNGSAGHVLVYIGNNEMVECGGGYSYTNVKGKKNGAIKVVYFDKRCKAYKKSSTPLYYINR